MKRTDVRLGCAARRGVLQIGVYYKKKCTYLIYTTVMFKIICNIDSCYDQFDFINPNTKNYPPKACAASMILNAS